MRFCSSCTCKRKPEQWCNVPSRGKEEEAEEQEQEQEQQEQEQEQEQEQRSGDSQ